MPDYIVVVARMGGESYVPSVIRLLFLMNVGTAFDNKIFWAWLFGESPNSKVLTFNIKSKVVLAKIPGHFLVGDRRPPILYARLYRSCSSLKYDLFQSNIITDSRCEHKFYNLYEVLSSIIQT
jgi:hypothetical protein